MSYADDIRQYCKDNIIAPARRRGEEYIVIRAGDIHKAMGYQSRMPSVCGALGANKFEEIAGVDRVCLKGPAQGANAMFTFRIR